MNAKFYLIDETGNEPKLYSQDRDFDNWKQLVDIIKEFMPETNIDDDEKFDEIYDHWIYGQYNCHQVMIIARKDSP